LMPSTSKLSESNENKIPVTLRITGVSHPLNGFLVRVIFHWKPAKNGI
jgi:hypothetical protein